MASTGQGADGLVAHPHLRWLCGDAPSWGFGGVLCPGMCWEQREEEKEPHEAVVEPWALQGVGEGMGDFSP